MWTAQDIIGQYYSSFDGKIFYNFCTSHTLNLLLQFLAWNSKHPFVAAEEQFKIQRSKVIKKTQPCPPDSSHSPKTDCKLAVEVGKWLKGVLQWAVNKMHSISSKHWMVLAFWSHPYSHYLVKEKKDGLTDGWFSPLFEPLLFSLTYTCRWISPVTAF